MAAVHTLVILSGVVCREGPLQLAQEYTGPSLAQDENIEENQNNQQSKFNNQHFIFRVSMSPW